MAHTYKLTIRHGPRVLRSRHPCVNDAISALEGELRALTAVARRPRIDLKVRQFEPVAQIVARGEISGPGRFFPTIRAGVDLRGDGSIEAYVGRMNRRLVLEGPGESAYAALGRELSQSESAAP